MADNDRRKIDTRLSTTRELRELCSLFKSWNWFLKPDNSKMNQGLNSKSLIGFWRREAWKSKTSKGDERAKVIGRRPEISTRDAVFRLQPDKSDKNEH